jgi:predicted DNA-binding transcriptional regulator AlpA
VALLTIGEVRERVPVSRPTIYALIKRAAFPKPRKLPGKGNVSWWEREAVEAWARANGYRA